MVTAHECAQLLSLTPVRTKQILKEMYEEEIIRTSANGKIKVTHSQIRGLIELRGAKYKQTTAVIGMEKGGVGKSLLTCNVAIKKAQLGARVLVIDLDPESCATNLLLDDDHVGTDYKTILEILSNNLNFKDAILPTRFEGLDLIPCKGRARRADRYIRDENLGSLYKNKMEGLFDIYDLILFEVPPTFSNIIASAYISSEMVIMPTFPDSWSLESVMLTLEDIKEECDKWSVPVPKINVLLNKYRPDRSASKDAWNVLINDFSDMVLPFQIRESADLQNAINEGKSIFEIRASKVVKESITELADFICPLSQPEKHIHH